MSNRHGFGDLQQPKLTPHQLSVLDAAVRAETRVGDIATLEEIGKEHGTTAANVRGLLKQLVPLGFVGVRTRGKHSTYYVIKDAAGVPFDRRAEHAQYMASGGPSADPPAEADRVKKGGVTVQVFAGEPEHGLTAGETKDLRALIALYHKSTARAVTMARWAEKLGQAPHTVEKVARRLLGKRYIAHVSGYGEFGSYYPLFDPHRRAVRRATPASATGDGAAHKPTAPPGGVREPLVQVLETALELAREPDVLHLPVLGVVAAGRPIEAAIDDARTFAIAAEWLRGRNGYLLRVEGESMLGDRIHSGDLVLVVEEPFDQARPRSIWVCQVPGVGATLKRVETKKDVAELVASNPAFEPILAPEGTIVQGRAIKLIRDLE